MAFLDHWSGSTIGSDLSWYEKIVTYAVETEDSGASYSVPHGGRADLSPTGLMGTPLGAALISGLDTISSRDDKYLNIFDTMNDLVYNYTYFLEEYFYGFMNHDSSGTSERFGFDWLTGYADHATTDASLSYRRSWYRNLHPHAYRRILKRSIC